LTHHEQQKQLGSSGDVATAVQLWLEQYFQEHFSGDVSNSSTGFHRGGLIQAAIALDIPPTSQFDTMQIRLGTRYLLYPPAILWN
jgi:hypothetical protein